MKIITGSLGHIGKPLTESLVKGGHDGTVISNEQMKSGLLSNGVPQNAAENLAELGEATHKGSLREEFATHKPTMGKAKLEEYAKEFAAAYNSDKK